MNLVWNTYSGSGHNNDVSSYYSNDDSHRLIRNLIRSIIDLEEDFVTRLQIFLDNVISSIQLRDSVEKRELVQNQTVISCFVSWEEFCAACNAFIQDLNQLCSNLDYNGFYHAFANFKPTLQSFSIYFKGICNVINVFSSLSNPITSELNLSEIFFELSMEDYLVLPIQHYENYANYFKNILDQFTPYLDQNTYPIFEELYQDFRSSTQSLQDTLLEEGCRFQLLALQQQFKGRPAIYSPTRILLLDGQLSLILPTAGSNGYITKIIYGHLFNDCMMYSEILHNNESSNNKYEFLSIIDFSLMKISVKATKDFDFIITRGTAKDTFHCHSPEERDKWVTAITQSFQDASSHPGLRTIQGIVNNLADKNMSAVLNQLQCFMGIQKPPVVAVDSTGSTPSTPILSIPPPQQQQQQQQPKMSQSSQLVDTAPIQCPITTDHHHLLISSTASSNSSSSSYVPHPSRATSPQILALQSLQSTLKQNMFALDILNQVIVQPILLASKGASLRVGSIDIPTDPEADTSRMKSTSGSSAYSKPIVDIGSWVSRSSHKISINNKYSRTSANYCVIVDQLRNYDIQVFMSSIVEILTIYRSICQQMDQLLMRDSNENEVADNMIVETTNTLFLSTITDSLFSHYVSCANTLQSVIRLSNTTLLEFMKEADAVVAPREILSIFHSIPGGLKRILFQYESLRTKLSDSKHHHDNINTIVKKIEASVLSVEQAIYSSRNEEKMVEIRASFASMDPQLEIILYSHRIFLREGNLIKVCRKKQKLFHFWLFHDYIIYGSAVNSLVGGTYKFSRALKLDNVSVREHCSDTTGNYDSFELLSTEKSFIVIASNEEEALDWILDIRSAVKGLLGESNSSDDSSSTLVAPLWINDKEAEKCSICEQAFTLFNRRHHCRQCGAVICSTHSKHRAILPNIHRSEKQRVCDHCFFHLPPPLPPTSTASTTTPVSMTSPTRNSTASSVSTPTTPPTKNSTNTYTTATGERSPATAITSTSRTPVRSFPSSAHPSSALLGHHAASLTESRIPNSPIKKVPSPPTTPQSKLGFPRPIEFRTSSKNIQPVDGSSVNSYSTTSVPYSAVSVTGRGERKSSSHSVFGDDSVPVSVPAPVISVSEQLCHRNSSESSNSLLSTLTSLNNANTRSASNFSAADNLNMRRASTGTAAAPFLSQSCQLVPPVNHRSKIILKTATNFTTNQPSTGNAPPPPPPPPPRRASITSQSPCCNYDRNSSNASAAPPPPPPPPRKTEVTPGSVPLKETVIASTMSTDSSLSKSSLRSSVVTPDDLKRSIVMKNNQSALSYGVGANFSNESPLENVSNKGPTGTSNRPVSMSNATRTTNSDSGRVLSMLSAVMQDRRNSILQVAKHDVGDDKSDASSSGFSDSDSD